MIRPRAKIIRRRRRRRSLVLLAAFASLCLMTVPLRAVAAEEPESPPAEGSAPSAYTPPAVTEPAPPEGQASCPEPPSGTYEGGDEAAAETRALRSELATVCAALSDRLDRVRERAFWTAAAQGEGNVTVVAQLGKLQQLVEGQCAQPCTVKIDQEGKALLVEGTGSEGSGGAEVVKAIEEAAQALKWVLWFIAAVAVTGLIGYASVRLVVFRDN